MQNKKNSSVISVINSTFHPAQQLPHVQIKIFDKMVNALIDSGSASNFIRTSVIPSKYSSVLQEETPQSVLFACGYSKITSFGSVSEQFSIENTKFNCNFQILSELEEEIILGAPFLEQNKVVIDYGRKCIYAGVEERKTFYFRQNCNMSKHSFDLPDDLEIPEQYKLDLYPLFQEFSELFSINNLQPTTSTTKHSIRLKENKIIQQKPYRVSPKNKAVLYEQIQQMLQASVIEPSNSEYSSPIVLVDKLGTQPRFCIDFRALNNITIDEPSNLPKITDTMKDLGDAKIFTVIDLKSGYWQVPLSDDSKRYTAFCTPEGHLYHFNVMPFGLKNAPCTFQRLMTQEVLSGYLQKFVMVYLDDIIIYSPNFELHKKHLRLVLERLRLHNLHVSPAKCQIASSSINYLGYRIEQDTNTPQTKHIKGILNFSIPKNKKQLQAFLGTCNWVREFIPNLSDITSPLTRLLQKNVRFRWTEEQDVAFNKIKSLVGKPLVLHRPNFNEIFVLQTDASDKGMGCILYQEDPNKSKRIVSYASATFSKTESHYHVNEKECLCIVWAIKRYRHYLQDRPFLLRTDNRSLLWLEKNKDAKTKLTRWSLLLQEFSFSIEHVPGKDNELPDLLSRHPEGKHDLEEPEDKFCIPSFENRGHITSLVSNNIPTSIDLFEEITGDQGTSQEILKNITKLRNITANGPQSRREQTFLNTFYVNNGLLWRRHPSGDKLVVPRISWSKVMSHYHNHADKAHPGRDETIRCIFDKFYFKNMNKIVGQYIKQCLVCLSMKTMPQTSAPLRPHRSQHPWQKISVDIMGPYPPSTYGHQYILVVEDIFSKWVEAKTFKQVTGQHLVRYLENEIFYRFGTPQTIVSDNGPQFISKLYTKMARKYKIQLKYSPIYHARANPVERRNQELKKIIRTLLADQPKNKWQQYIGQALFILRTRKNAAINTTPSKCLLGYELPRPGDWNLPVSLQPTKNPISDLSQSHEEIRQHQQHYQAKYTTEPIKPPPSFKKGDLVMVRDNRQFKHPFDPVWSGPHKVLALISKEVYDVERDGKPYRLHVDDLRPAPGNEEAVAIVSHPHETSCPNEIELEVDQFIPSRSDSVKKMDSTSVGAPTIHLASDNVSLVSSDEFTDPLGSSRDAHSISEYTDSLSYSDSEADPDIAAELPDNTLKSECSDTTMPTIPNFSPTPTFVPAVPVTNESSNQRPRRVVKRRECRCCP